MGEARQIMDRVTEAAFSGDSAALDESYADDANGGDPGRRRAHEAETRSSVGCSNSPKRSLTPAGKS